MKELENLLFNGIGLVGIDNLNSNIKVDIIETETQYEYRFFIPGFLKEDLKVEVVDSNLVVSVKPKIHNRKVLRREFEFEKIERKVRLMNETDIHEIRANYNDGILSLQIPKIRKESRMIEIN